MYVQLLLNIVLNLIMFKNLVLFLLLLLWIVVK